MTESSQDKNITLLTYSEVEDVKGSVGNFEVTIRKKARYVDISKCTGCGECRQKCPQKKIPNEFNLGLNNRTAIYIPFPQAVPNVPVIDRENCTYFTKGKCQVCAKVCPTGAIDYEQKDEIITEKFGAIVIATGFSLFDIKNYGEYGGGRFKNVITSLHLERMLDSSGPTSGKIIRPSDGKEVRDVVFLQCVGSRDEAKGVPYCSRICCMYTAKHALLLKDHYPETQSYIFYIDIRSGGKNYEEFVKRAQQEYGAIYLRGRVSRIYELGEKLVVCGVDTLVGKPVKLEADLVVLAPAIVPNADAIELAQKLRIPYDKYGFYTELHPKLQPVESVTKGIFLTGSCSFPKDIPDSVAMSGAAAAGVCSVLSRDELIVEPKIATVDDERCTGCLNCVNVCPFEAIETHLVNGVLHARVIESLCQGCGNCASTCRVKAVTIKGFTDDQIYAQIEAAMMK